MASSGTATCRVSARASNTATGWHGPYAPGRGQRCNAAKLLLDPYGTAVEGQLRWREALFSHRSGAPDAFNTRDSAPFMPRNVVINPYFDWGHDRPPRIPYHETVT